MYKKIKVNSVNKTISRSTEQNLYQEKYWRKLDTRRGNAFRKKGSRENYISELLILGSTPKSGGEGIGFKGLCKIPKITFHFCVYVYYSADMEYFLFNYQFSSVQFSHSVMSDSL